MSLNRIAIRWKHIVVGVALWAALASPSLAVAEETSENDGGWYGYGMGFSLGTQLLVQPKMLGGSSALVLDLVPRIGLRWEPKQWLGIDLDYSFSRQHDEYYAGQSATESNAYFDRWRLTALTPVVQHAHGALRLGLFGSWASAVFKETRGIPNDVSGWGSSHEKARTLSYGAVAEIEFGWSSRPGFVLVSSVGLGFSNTDFDKNSTQSIISPGGVIETLSESNGSEDFFGLVDMGAYLRVYF